MSHIALLVATEQEAATLRKRVPLKVLVLPFPLFGHDKKTKAEIAQLCYDDFKFLHTSVFEDFLLENDVSSFNTLAPHNQEGLDWLAHVDHLSSMPWQDDNLGFEYRTYTDINHAEHSINTIGHSCLEHAYNHYVFGSITAAWFHADVAKPLAKKIFGTVKAAYSLGMYRVIYFLYHMENNRSLSFGIESGSSTYNPGHYVRRPITYVWDASRELVVPNIEATTANTSVEVQTSNQRRGLASETVDEHIYDSVDPYITCLLCGFPIKNFTDMVSSGVLSVPVPANIEPPNHADLCKGLDARVSYLVFNSVTDSYERKPLEDGSCYGAFALRSLEDSDCLGEIGHAVLFEHYNTQTLLRVLPTPASLVDVHIRHEAERITSDTFPVLDTTASSTGSSWVNLLDPTLLLRIPSIKQKSFVSKVNAVFDVSDTPAVLGNLFEALAASFGYRYGYVYNIIKGLARRGVLTISNTGVRLTSYGFGVGSMLNTGTGHNESTDNDSGFQGLDKCWHEMLKSLESSSRNLMTSQDGDNSCFDSGLDNARRCIDEIAETVKAYEGIETSRLNKKTGKRRRYKLVLDRNKKISYWASLSGSRKLPVSAQIVKYNPTGLNHLCEGNAPVHELEPTLVNTKTMAMIEIMESPCCECGHTRYLYVVSETDPVLELQCKSCGSRTSAVFNPIVVNLGTTEPREDGDSDGADVFEDGEDNAHDQESSLAGSNDSIDLDDNAPDYVDDSNISEDDDSIVPLLD